MRKNFMVRQNIIAKKMLAKKALAKKVVGKKVLVARKKSIVSKNALNKNIVKKNVIRKNANSVKRSALIVAETNALLKRISRVSDPRRHNEFNSLKYSNLKKRGFDVKVLNKKFGFRTGDLFRIGVPVPELIRHFGMNHVLSYTEYASPRKEVIPLSEFRKARVPARDLLGKKLSFGALYHYGGYSKQQLLSAGVPKEKLALLKTQGNPLSR